MPPELEFKVKPEWIKRILIRTPNWIGDAVLSIPAMTAVRKHFRNSKISILGPDSVIQLLLENKIADDFISLDNNYRSVGGKLRLIQNLKKQRFDLAILFQNAFEAALITFLSSIRYRYGYNRDGRGFLLTDPVPFFSKSEKIHQLQFYLNLVKPLIGVEPVFEKPVLKISEREKARARILFEEEGILENKKMIGMNPGAAYGSAKRWLPERFSQLADRFIRETQSQVVFFGSSSETALVKKIQSQMTEKSFALTGKTNLRELIAAIARCSWFVTNDSGPMHIASALNIPTLSIFGPTDDTTTSPVGDDSVMIKKNVECSPCLMRECPIDHRCMTSITVDEVFNLFHTSWLSGKESSSPAVFLDRDGTINEDTHYVSSEEQFKIFPETSEGILLLNQIQVPVFVVSNQSGVERGFFTEALLLKLHMKLEADLNRVQAKISGFYYCPHRPETGCFCRKPKVGMINKILEKYPVNLKKSYFVGDQLSDLELANRIGAKGILVLTGKGKETLMKLKDQPDIIPVYVADNILHAARWIQEDFKNADSDLKQTHKKRVIARSETTKQS
ncbi:MAG: lipopolysaccharide heptosyltransferase II [Nitrospirae bacterium]|nr:lipopolysaccharide heptosyltransferase II [Nitrospirota bacterium]